MISRMVHSSKRFHHVLFRENVHANQFCKNLLFMGSLLAPLPWRLFVTSGRLLGYGKVSVMFRPYYITQAMALKAVYVSGRNTCSVSGNGCLHQNNNMDDFRVLPVKFSEFNKACHYLYYKQHEGRESHSCKPVERTLFVLSVPPYCDQECLKRLFGDCGKVARVYFHQKPTSSAPEKQSKLFSQIPPVVGFKVAYIVFQTSEGMENALNIDTTKPRILSTKEHQLPVGIKKWCADYKKSVPRLKVLKEEIDSFMAEYDSKNAQKQRLEKQQAEPDAEGWVTVTRSGKKPGFSRTEATIDKLNRKEKKKRAKKELLNFYTFQIRESKMQHINQLRKKFEEDKKKIALMKASRKFKPF